MRYALGTRRAYLAIAAILAIGTVAGMVLLWPHGDAPKFKFVEGAHPGHTDSAEINSVKPFSCSSYGRLDCQKVAFTLTSGPHAGSHSAVEFGRGNGTPEYSSGDHVRVVENQLFPGARVTTPSYTILDFERQTPLLWLTIAFCALVIIFGRLRGGLSLVGLAISLLIVLFFVVPAIIRDTSPLAVALVGSMAVMLTTIPLAHGFGPKSLAAIAGTGASLFLVVGLAVVFTHVTHLTGLSGDESAILAVNNSGISFQGLLIAGMVIGSLGVLDDVTISQASTVMALRGANPTQGFRELYRRAIDVGRDHVSATVNTLVLAYVGTSLTTLLIFGSGEVGFLDAVNLEVIASVIVATLVGSIGLICAVPITTALAALLAEGIPAEELVDAEPHIGHAH
jgi:uncharacterized membrane protein